MNAQDMVLALRALGLSQMDISRETLIPQPTISRIESGASKDTSYSKARKLQELLDRLSGEQAA